MAAVIDVVSITALYARAWGLLKGGGGPACDRENGWSTFIRKQALPRPVRPKATASLVRPTGERQRVRCARTRRPLAALPGGVWAEVAAIGPETPTWSRLASVRAMDGVGGGVSRRQSCRVAGLRACPGAFAPLSLRPGRPGPAAAAARRAPRRDPRGTDLGARLEAAGEGQGGGRPAAPAGARPPAGGPRRGPDARRLPGPPQARPAQERHGRENEASGGGGLVLGKARHSYPLGPWPYWTTGKPWRAAMRVLGHVRALGAAHSLGKTGLGHGHALSSRALVLISRRSCSGLLV